MDRLEGASAAQLTIYWEGRPVPARADDSVAAALHAAGIRTIGRTRKLHRSLGSGGTFALGLQAEAEGIPNVRIDRLPVREGLRLRAQNVWPNARFDLLRLARFIPRRWLRGGFEHPSWLPSGRPGFEAWERMLRFLAGGGRAIRPSRPGAIVAGEKIQADVAIVGGGPAGRQAAIEAASRQQSVVMISRSLQPGRFAEAMGRRLPAIPDGARVLAGFEAFGLYRRGRILAAAPHDGSGAAVVEARKIVLATGARSIPPLVPGADLPGVMDLPTAAGLLHFHRIAPGRAVVLIGSGDLSAVSDRLRGLGARIVGEAAAGSVLRIRGRSAVEGVVLAGGRTIDGDALVHAGPWRGDPLLPFQAAADGELRLADRGLPEYLSLAGAAAGASEPVACAKLDDGAFVCPCMDVTVAEIRDLAAGGETHVEVLKRLTGCGMGPCQGIPCWDYLAATLAALTRQPAESFGHPSYRPPRGALTLGQAAGLADLVPPEGAS